MTKGIKLFTVTWSTDTAGPSPDKNMRTEIFFKGCDRAMEGNPCIGCFNRDLWHSYAKDKVRSAQEIADQIEKHAPNKYVTIGGGEPTAQLDGLVELTKLLKDKGFHIMVYTWKELEDMLLNKTGQRREFIDLLINIDMLVDGEFKMHERLYRQEAKDGFFSSIGSANQKIWSTHTLDNGYVVGYSMGDIEALKINKKNELEYTLLNQEAELLKIAI